MRSLLRKWSLVAFGGAMVVWPIIAVEGTGSRSGEVLNPVSLGGDCARSSLLELNIGGKTMDDHGDCTGASRGCFGEFVQ